MRRYFTPGASGMRLGSLLLRPSPIPSAVGPPPCAGACAGCPRRRRSSPCPWPRSRRLRRGLGLARLLRHLGGEVVGSSSRDPRRARSGRSGGPCMFSPILATSSVSSDRMSFLPSGSFTHDLIEQADLLRPLRDLAVDDLGDHRLGLARLLGLLDADRLLLLEHRGRDLVLRDVRTGSSPRSASRRPWRRPRSPGCARRSRSRS